MLRSLSEAHTNHEGAESSNLKLKEDSGSPVGFTGPAPSKGSLIKQQQAVVARQVIVLSHGSTGTENIYAALCHLRIPSLHLENDCNRGIPTSHRRLLEAYEQAVQCCAGNLSAQWCDSHRWAERVRTDLFNLAVTSSRVALLDAPYPNILPGLASFIVCGAKLIISVRDPRDWAASHALDHGEDVICTQPAPGNDPLDLYSCAALCPWDTLTACFTRQDRIGVASLAAAFNLSQSRMLEKYGRKSLVLNLFAGVPCDQACLSKRLEEYLDLEDTTECVDVRSSASEQPSTGPALSADVTTSATSAARNPKFYLWRFKGIEMEPAVNFWREMEANHSFDAAVPMALAEYLNDIPLLQALRTHPARTYHPDEASLHILDVPAYASYARAYWAAMLPGSQSESESLFKQHYSQMVKVAFKLNENRYFLEDAPFLYFTARWPEAMSFWQRLIRDSVRVPHSLSALFPYRIEAVKQQKLLRFSPINRRGRKISTLYFMLISVDPMAVSDITCSRSFFSVGRLPLKVVDALLHELHSKRHLRSVSANRANGNVHPQKYDMQHAKLKMTAFCLLPRHRLLV
ncbi:MAG: hypothetical protein SGPRY_002866, partial [Prymnesium sp.]